MKIVIAGGQKQLHQIEYITSYFSENEKNRLVIIVPTKEAADYLVARCRLTVNHGEPWRRYILEGADAYNADVFISLCDTDADNFATCMMAKKVFAAKKSICVVDNPGNVDLFKELGLDSVISSTYLLAQSISSETSMESFAKTLSLENDKLNVVEAVVLSRYEICFKQIKDIHFPPYASISAIIRNYQLIIPNGLVELQPKDTLFMVTDPSHNQDLLDYVQTSRVGGPVSIRKLIEARSKEAASMEGAPESNVKKKKAKK